MITGIELVTYRKAKSLTGWLPEATALSLEAALNGPALLALLQEALADQLEVETLPSTASELVALYGENEAIQRALEAYARRLAYAVMKLETLPEWRGMEALYLGGGALETPVGERLLPLAQEALAKAGWQGTCHLLPGPFGETALHGAPLFCDYDAPPPAAWAVVDLGATNLRWALHVKRVSPWRSEDFAALREVGKQAHYAHRTGRQHLVELIADKLGALARLAEREHQQLAGACCTTPGTLNDEGAVIEGASGLPDWCFPSFHLKNALSEALHERLGEKAPSVCVVPDAVAHLLAALPTFERREVGALVIGSGLGNVRVKVRGTPSSAS